MQSNEKLKDIRQSFFTIISLFFDVTINLQIILDHDPHLQNCFSPAPIC